MPDGSHGRIWAPLIGALSLIACGRTEPLVPVVPDAGPPPPEFQYSDIGPNCDDTNSGMELDLLPSREAWEPEIIALVKDKVVITPGSVWDVPTGASADFFSMKTGSVLAVSGRVHFVTFVDGSSATGDWSFDFGSAGASKDPSRQFGLCVGVPEPPSQMDQILLCGERACVDPSVRRVVDGKFFAHLASGRSPR